MHVVRPQFREGLEWRRLTKAERNGRPWKYVLLKDVFFEVETGVTRHYDCKDGDGNVWMKILPHGILMCAQYAWNGNSLSPDSMLGILLILGSLPHDGLFQFSGCEGFPLSIWFANCLYLALSPPQFGWGYYLGLCAGSWAFWKRPPHAGDHIEHRPLHQEEPT